MTRCTRAALAGTVATLVAVALVAAACGGGSSAGSVASMSGSVAAGTPAASGTPVSLQASVVAYARCMRDHGVPNFPDPDGSGALPKEQIAPLMSSPYFQPADGACRGLLPNGGNGPTQAQMQQRWTDYLNFAGCMRARGVPDFPDPTSDPHGRPLFDLQVVGIDGNSAPIRATAQQCQSLLHMDQLPAAN